jgi:hypothetical protein
MPGKEAKMAGDNLYRTESVKPLSAFVRDLAMIARKYGFIIHNQEKMDMGATFRTHGTEVAAEFDLHMMQLCKPEKAAKSLGANPERAILMPKFIMAFTKDEKTQVRFLQHGQDEIRRLVADEAFSDSLAETYARIKAIIEEAR